MNRSSEDKEILVSLGEKIREVRILKNISQIKLAALCDTEKTNLSRLEKGNTNPTFLTLQKIAQKLHVQLCDLLPMLKAQKNA